MTDTIQPGTRVKVEYEGIYRGGGRVYSVDHGSPGQTQNRRNYYEPDAVKITPLEPAHWPPRPGDVWELPDGTVLVVKENLYTARWEASTARTGRSKTHPVYHDRSDGTDSALKALQPTLLFRLEEES